MRKFGVVYLWGIFCLGLLFSGCSKEDFGLAKGCACGPEAVQTVSESRGILHFNQQLRKYTILRSASDSPDARLRLLVLTEVPAGYPLEAQDVIFSGQITPACPGTYAGTGQQYYDITLSKLKRAE